MRILFVMYRDESGPAGVRVVAAREALEELEGMPRSSVDAGAVDPALLSPQDVEALAQRLEMELAKRRAEIARDAGPTGALRMREVVPYWSYAIHTSSTEEETIDALRGLLLAGTFEGRFLDDGELKATRHITYRNSFLPVVFARPTARPYGASVRIRMRMNLFTSVFMATWLLGASAGTIGGLFAVITTGNVSGLVTLAFPMFGLLMIVFGFGVEARKAHRAIRAVLPAVSVDASGHPVRRRR